VRKLLPFLVVFAAATNALAANPTITSINPSCAIAGGPQFTLTVNGTNYDNTSVVRWNGANLATTFVSSTKLTAIVPAANIATAGTPPITVKNSTGSASNSVTFTIVAPPTISSLNPTCATAGGPGFTLTVNGTNFAAISTVNWNGTALATTFVSATQLTATVPAALIATAGTASVTVVSCGGTSNAQTFTIVNTPVITSPLTACGTIGVAFSYTITATNNPTSFTASPLPAGLSVNASTGVISGTPTTAGTPSVTISASNGASSCNTASATLVITIRTAPTISSLSPTCATAGGPQFTLTVNGTNFVSGSTVNWNGTPLVTTFVSAAQLTATVPAALIATAGTASITVVTPCGGTSNAQTFTIANTPVITSPLTACGTRNVAFSYTITATNSPTSFTASPLPAGLSVNTSTGVISGTPTTTGTTNVTITARNGAGTCNTATATLVITISTAPTISSLNPNCTAAGGPQFTLTVNGNNFVSTSTVNWNGSPLATTFVSSTRLTATVPAALIATPGTASVTVGTCATNSGAATFTISAAPAISSLSPTCASAGDPQFTLTVNGTNFVSTSIVNWNGAALTTTFVSSTQLTATVSAARIANPGTASITVVSPCGGTSNAVIFPIDDTPSITSLLTASATVGSPFSYQITANNNPISYDATGLPQGLTLGPIPGLISGTPTGAGVFPVTITATNNANDPCSGTATDTLLLTVSFPGGVFIAPFPGEVNVFNWGSTPPPNGATIPFPNPSTNNSFVLKWNPPGSNTNPTIIDSPGGGLQRNADPVGMQYNPYDPTVAGSRPDPTKNVWRGNPTPPNDITSGQFGDPRASWYVTDPWPTADYVTGSYWAGPNPSVNPLNWPDSGHAFTYTGLQPTGKGQYPSDIMASPTPTPNPTKAISLLSTSNTGVLTSITELGNVWDPAQLVYNVANPGGPLPDIPSSATSNSKGAGGHTLAIGRPEFSKFDQNGMRAWQLLDVFSGKTIGTNFTNTAGLVNLNTASRDVLRSLAAGILQNSDPAIQPTSLQNNLYPPTNTGANRQQADKFADAVINSRPLLSTAALSAIRDPQGQPFFGNPNQYNGSTQTPPTEWNDPGREELFAKIYNLATTRSRNFRVFVTGQSLDKNGNVLSTVTKVYQVFVKPTRDPNTGAIQSQQVVIKYEGSM
jgi:Putative Ig domain/IPT/TIG domain